MLARLQQQLSDIYQVDRGYDVRDFLITDPTLARQLGRDAVLTNTEETLLLAEDGEELALSLFLDEALLERLETADPLGQLRPEQLDDLWKVVEGISHFSCVVWKASKGRRVSLLELELQGEIDKFVCSILLAIGQSDIDVANRMHGWLFDDVSFHAELDAEQLARYQAANDYAARFCRGLKDQLIADDKLALDGLRRFYRLQLADKISHIHSQAW
ncbi:MAG: hypothetical protein QNJ00_08080 [Woeseiaceae bacterium]|nr:hypothetical protein [Woeseiaceae bacterium]